MPKHEGHATVAKSDLQNKQLGASDETAAPHEGQFKVAAFINLRAGKGGKRRVYNDNPAPKVCHIYAKCARNFFALHIRAALWFNYILQTVFNPQSAFCNPQLI
jgi:hypothetical protein